jgi:hypothetical protein
MQFIFLLKIMNPRTLLYVRKTTLKLSLRLRCRMEFGLFDNLVGQAESSRVL